MIRRSMMLLALCLSGASPAAAQDDGWTLGVSNEDTHVLDYAPSISRLYRLSCPPHGGPVLVTVVFDNPRGVRRWTSRGPTSLAITTPRVSVTVRGRVEPVLRTPWVEASLPADAPVIAAFRETGRIQFRALSQTLTPAVAPPSLVADFLRLCRRAR